MLSNQTPDYANPKHALDLTLSDLNDIRLKFQEYKLLASQNNQEEDGISLDAITYYPLLFLQYLAQLLAEKLSEEPSKIQKYLKKMTQFKQINWNQFLELLDVESDLRHELLDWIMNDIKTKKFVSYQTKVLKPLNRSTDRIYYIEKLLQFNFLNQSFMMVVFDDSTLSIFDMANYEIVSEFKIPYEFTMQRFLEQEKAKIQKIQQRYLIYEKKDKDSKIGTESRNDTRQRKRASSQHEQIRIQNQNFMQFSSIKKNSKISTNFDISADKSVDSQVNLSQYQNIEKKSQFKPQNVLTENINEQTDELNGGSSRKIKLSNLELTNQVVPKHLNFIQRALVATKVHTFIANLKQAVANKKNFKMFQSVQKPVKKQTTTDDYEDYLKKHKDHVHKMFQIFKLTPLKETGEFCSRMTNLIDSKQIQSVKMDDLNQVVKGLKYQQGKRQKLDSQSQITQWYNINYRIFEIEKVLINKNKNERINLLQRDLNQMTKIVDIDPRTLKPRSNDPKVQNQNVSQQSQSTTKQHLQQYLEERKRNRSKNSDKKNQKSKNMFVTCMNYCQETELLFVGLINQEIKIYKFCYNEKNLTYYIEKKDILKGPDVPKSIELTRHRIKNVLTCIVTYKNNHIRIYVYSYISKQQILNFDQTPVNTYIAPFDITCFTYYITLGIVISGSTGDFAVMMDHFIKVPNFTLKKNNYNFKVCQETEKNPFYFLTLKRKLETKEGLFCFTCQAYSDTHKLLIFGTQNGKIVFFNVLSNEIIAIKQGPVSQILNIYSFDEQNQVISISQDFSVLVWDIMRQETIQTFKTIKDISQDFHYEIHTTYFNHLKGMIYVAGNTLQTWIARKDNERQFKRQKVQSIHFWRNRQMDKKNKKKVKQTIFIHILKKTLIGKQLYMELKDEEQNKRLPPNIFVKRQSQLNYLFIYSIRKIPLQITRILFVAQSKDQFLLFDSTKHIKIFSLQNLRLAYSFLFDIPEQVEELTCFNTSDDLKIIGYGTISQEVKIFNLYSQEQIQMIDTAKHILYLNFLPVECEYFFLVGLEDGQIQYCASYLKSTKKVQNKTFKVHQKPLVLLESNTQFLVSISEDHQICIWSLNSCSLKNKLYLPINDGQASSQSLPAMIQFVPGNGKLFMVLTNGGDIHEYDAFQGIAIRTFCCKLDIINGLGCFSIKRGGKKLITIDGKGEIKIYGRREKQLSNQKMDSPMKKGKSKRNLDFEQLDSGWECEQVIDQLCSDFNFEMIPLKIIYQEDSGLYHLFCGIKKMYIIDDKCQVVCTLDYEKNQIYSCFYDEPKSEEENKSSFNSQFIQLINK